MADNTSLFKQKFSNRFLFHLNRELVYGNAFSTEYQGDATQVGSVKINNILPVKGYEYDGGKIPDPVAVTSEAQILNIDKMYMNNFFVSDLDQLQTDVALLNEYSKEQAIDVANYFDKKIAATYTEVPTSSYAETSVIDTPEKAYNYIVDKNILMNEMDIPKSGRFMILPEFVGGHFNKDSRATISTAFNVMTQQLPQGIVINGTKIYFSNNVPVVDGVHYPLAGLNKAIAFVSGLNKIRTIDTNRDYWRTEVQLLNVWGMKVIKPEALLVAPIKKA